MLIISKKFEAPSGWGDMPVQIGDIKDCLCNEEEGSYFKENENSVLFAKWKTFFQDGHEYNVYVVPCLKDDADDNVKAGYLESVVSEVVKHSNVEPENNVFLIAHDKDFSVDAEKDVLANGIPGEETRQNLKNLIERNQIFLFRHQRGGELYQYIALIPRDQPPLFNYNSCSEIIKLVLGYKKMHEYYKELV